MRRTTHTVVPTFGGDGGDSGVEDEAAAFAEAAAGPAYEPATEPATEPAYEDPGGDHQLMADERAISAQSRTNHSENSQTFLSPTEAEQEVAPLQSAASKGNKRAVGEILTQAERSGKLFDVVNSKDALGRTALIYGAVSAKLPVMTLLVDRGALVNEIDLEGRTALLWAVYYDKVKSIQFLIRKGCDINISDAEGHSFAHFCSRNKTTKVFQLLSKALDLESPNGDGRAAMQEFIKAPDHAFMTPLHWAAYHSALDYARILIRLGASTTVVDGEGKTPIHWAATKNNVLLLKILVEQIITQVSAQGDYMAANAQHVMAQRDAILNSGDMEGRTPLHLAVGTGNIAVAQYLLSIPGCRVDSQDESGRTPLHWAVQFGHDAMVATLLEHGGTAQFFTLDANGWTALHYAVHDSYVECVTQMLAFDQIQDQPNNHGQTALMIAASGGNEQLLQQLLQFGSDPNAASSTASTALQMAALGGHVTACALLVASGADVNALDQAQQNTLMIACEQGSFELCSLLIDAGADLAAVDGDGRTILHIAASGGHSDLCAQLLQMGLDPNACDVGGRTPLHSAVYFNDEPNTTYVLIDGGADVNAQDSEGISAVHWAASKGSAECLAALLNAGAFPNHTEFHADRLTPLDYATSSGHTHIGEQLRLSGGLNITEVRELAAQHIQSWWTGYQTRIAILASWQRHLQQENASANKQQQAASSRKTKKQQPAAASSGKPRKRQSQLAPTKGLRTVGELGVVTNPAARQAAADKKTRYVRRPSLGVAAAKSPNATKAALNKVSALPSIISTAEAMAPASRKPLYAPKAISLKKSLPSINSQPKEGVPRLGYRKSPVRKGARHKGGNMRQLPTLRYYDDDGMTPMFNITAQTGLQDPEGTDDRGSSQGGPSEQLKFVQGKLVKGMTERRRVNLVRKKIDSAKIIQRAYRHWVGLGKPKPPAPPPLPPTQWRSPRGAKVDSGLYAKSPMPIYPRFPNIPSPPQTKVSAARGAAGAAMRARGKGMSPSPGSHCDSDRVYNIRVDIPDTRETQIAALTIQLAWRKHLRHSGRGFAPRQQQLSTVAANRAKGKGKMYHLSPEVQGVKNSLRDMRRYQIYTQPQPMMQWEPKLKRLAPAITRPLPSISITAFNVALDTYFPPEVRRRFESKRNALLLAESAADDILAQVGKNKAAFTKEREHMAELRDEARGVSLPLRKLDPHSTQWSPLMAG